MKTNGRIEHVKNVGKQMKKAFPVEIGLAHACPVRGSGHLLRVSRKPFAGLANKHMLTTLENMTGTSLPRPRALPKRENFTVSVARNLEPGAEVVSKKSTRTGDTATINGPMLEARRLIVRLEPFPHVVPNATAR